MFFAEKTEKLEQCDVPFVNFQLTATPTIVNCQSGVVFIPEKLLQDFDVDKNAVAKNVRKNERGCQETDNVHCAPRAGKAGGKGVFYDNISGEFLANNVDFVISAFRLTEI